MSGELTDATERECTIMDCSRAAEFAYWMPDLGQFSKVRNPEHDFLEDGDLAPYVCESCRDRMASSSHWDEDRFSRPEEKLVTDGGTDATEQARLDVGDTRAPAAIKNARRVTSGDLAALAMCAHRFCPEDVRGWYTHEYDDVVRQWICSNVGSVIARLSPHCEDTRGDRPPLHRSDDLWVGEVDTGPTQTTLAMTDGGHAWSSTGGER